MCLNHRAPLSCFLVYNDLEIDNNKAGCAVKAIIVKLVYISKCFFQKVWHAGSTAISGDTGYSVI